MEYCDSTANLNPDVTPSLASLPPLRTHPHCPPPMQKQAWLDQLEA